MKNNKAFTLIELLVVVLIIGILSAIALPRYQSAVEKARLARLMPMVRALRDAQNAYILANGTCSNNFSELDIDIPTPERIDPVSDTNVGERAFYSDFGLSLASYDCIVYGHTKKFGGVQFGMYTQATAARTCTSKKIAIVTASNTIGLQLIHNMGGQQYQQSGENIYFCIP